MKKLFILMAVIALLLSLSACGGPNVSDGGQPEQTTTNITADDTTPAPQTTTSLEGFIIVRADEMNAELTSACSKLYVSLKSALTSQVSIISDWIKGQEGDVVNDTKEILIGDTNRKESREAIAKLSSEYDYVICTTENKVVIAGKSDPATLNAIRVFNEMFIDKGVTDIPDDLYITYAPGAEGSVAHTLATQYTIIRADNGGDYSEEAIATMSAALMDITGLTPTLRTDDEGRVTIPETGFVTNNKEILLGHTNRAESIATIETVGAMDYTISITDSKVIICGGTYLSTIRGIEHFTEALISGEIKSLEAGSYSYKEVFTDLYTYNPLCYDSSSFVPEWKDIYSIPEWMCDFEEKTYAITQNSLRNMSVSHRGEIVFYPENSIEGILSAILGGADVIEIDVAQTKDHVLVLMHDSTLKRTTNFNEKKGTNGLPSSEYIWDWTYEELQQLSLKTNSGELTEYKIPTLYEALMVIKDRCFVQLDQKTKNLPFPRELTRNSEVFAMANEIGCRECFFYTYGLGVIANWQKFDDSDAEYNQFVTTVKKYLTSGGKLRSRYWCYGDAEVSTLNTSYEQEKYWVSLRAEGKTLLWANSLLKYSQYIADNFEPAKTPQ